MSDLITGGGGFLGFHLADRLSREGRKVVIVDNFIRADFDYRLRALLERDNVELLEGDLCDMNFVNGLPMVERVFHFAAFNGTQNFYENPMGVIRHSTIPALNLVERYVEQDQVKFFAYTGSSESYAGAIAQGITGVPTPESTPLVIDDITNPRWSYAAGKMHGEITVALTCQQKDIPWQVWRVHNCFGPRMGAKHVIPDFTERASRAVYELYGFEDTRTFLYVEDAIDICTRLAQTESAHNAITNVGGINEMTMLSLGQQVLKVMGKTGEIDCYDAPSGSIKRRRPDVTRLLGLLPDFEYRDFSESLKITVDSILDDISKGIYGTK